MVRVRSAAAWAAVIVVVAVGCKKKHEPIVVPFDATPPPEAPVDVEAKDTVRVIVGVYPAICDADAAVRSWTACRDATTGYASVHACAEKGLRDSKRARDDLRPSVDQHGECGEAVRKSAVLFLNTAPKYFGDVLAWMQDRHDKLVAPLTGKSLADACRATPALCAGEPHEWDDAYKAMHVRAIERTDCTARIFTCGQSDTADCTLASVAPRLGVACESAKNRRGASPDDLLYVRGTGTPIAR